MCLAIPAEVVRLLPGEMAVVSLDGVAKEISVALIEDLRLGDYVIVHVGYALAKVDPEEAKETLAMLRQLGACASGEPAP